MANDSGVEAACLPHGDAASADRAGLRLMIESAPIAMLLLDARDEIVRVNARLEQLFGYPRQALLGQPIDLLVAERHRAARPFRGDAPGAQSGALAARRELDGLRRDGAEIPIEIALGYLHAGPERLTLAVVSDLSARRIADKLARTSQTGELRQLILDGLPFSVITTDTEGIVIAANPATERLLGYVREELIGQPALIVHEPAELERRIAELTRQVGIRIPDPFRVIVAAAGRGRAEECEWTYRHKDGTPLPVNLAVTALFDDAGQATGFLLVAYNISERKGAEALIRHMAHHDALTGLPNRTLLLDRLELAILQARRRNEQLAVLMIDLDHFKRINDTLGHHNGDRLLLNVAKRMQKCVRDSDTVARFGGDEFVVVLSDVSSQGELAAVVGELAKAIAQPIFIDGRELTITPSIGGCMFPADAGEATLLLRNADTAMYCAKSMGRSNCQWFTQAMLRHAQEKLELGTAMRRAIDREDFTLNYQPEISLATGQVVGMEALLRWQHSLHGDISPDRFIPIAEETGMILELGEWALRTACCEFVKIQRRCATPLKLAVNVSPRQFQQKAWMDIVLKALSDSGLNPAQLELEITEGTLMENPQESSETLNAFRQLGMSVVIDDFGTGYSSLSYLHRFPIDKLKIDRSFIGDLTQDTADAAIVNAIIAMAHSLNIQVIAEGVETLEQLKYLQDRGCDEVQGYYFSKAVAADDFAVCIKALAA